MSEKVQIRCYETMGIPNSVALCSICKVTTTYFPGRAEREGFSSDYAAAEAWASKHVCQDQLTQDERSE